eukprot:TRINITY_DN13946_c0_g1_i1.p1 TRINITY_DN13946_c0_g1~~TRINITY_DN13946_c0_g1_i1.p1  ORF type:complete len:357 (+),score=52.34 TRINITY_DN13946_c0_g1_i1:117-1073(+)
MQPYQPGPHLLSAEYHKRLASLEAAKGNGHRRINCFPVMCALFVPWVTLQACFGFFASYWHYAAPVSLHGCAFVLFLIGLVILQKARKAKQHGADNFFQYYIGYSLLITLFLGCCFGDLTFYSKLRPVYELSYSATYTNVDPSSHTLYTGEVLPTRGRQFQDAGAIYFDSKAVLDMNRSTSFKMGTLYCVAPIVNPSCEKNCGHDFWAIGKNCCSEDASNFQCGQWNNVRAKSGLRSMDEESRPFYRLAVLEAEGRFGLRSSHPIFLNWVQDPLVEVKQMRRLGYRSFIIFMFVSFFGNVVVLAFTVRTAGVIETTRS